MPSIIRSANVGGMVAGNQPILVNPTLPSYATWPQFIQKEVGDILAIWRDNLRDRYDEEDERRTAPIPGEVSPKVQTALFGGGAMLLIAVAVIFFFMRGR